MDVQNTYNEHGGKKRKIYLMLFIAFTQPFLIWWLTRSVYNPHFFRYFMLKLRNACRQISVVFFSFSFFFSYYDLEQREYANYLNILILLQFCD